MFQVRFLSRALCLAAVCLALCQTAAFATELDSIYVRVRISPGQMANWLRSPMKHMHDFNDWSEMTPEWDESWKSHFYTWDFETMWAMVKARVREGSSRLAPVWGSRPYIQYDAKAETFTFAQLAYDENYINFMLDIAAYRTLADFKDTDGPDFLVIYPFLWDPGYAVIMEIGKGYTRFHTEETAPPEFKEFIETADAHFEAELEREQ